MVKFPVKQPWRVWVHSMHKSTKNYRMTSLKQSTTEYTVHLFLIILVLVAEHWCPWLWMILSYWISNSVAFCQVIILFLRLQNLQEDWLCKSHCMAAVVIVRPKVSAVGQSLLIFCDQTRHISISQLVCRQSPWPETDEWCHRCDFSHYKADWTWPQTSWPTLWLGSVQDNFIMHTCLKKHMGMFIREWVHLVTLLLLS